MNPAFRRYQPEVLDHFSAMAILLAGILGCAIAVAVMGQDAGWDLRNYHWYVPHALLEGRLGFDVLPSFMGPTFHNPLVDVPFYLAAQWLGPLAASIGLGLVHGLNAVPLYLIARRALPDIGCAAAAVLAVLGLGGAMNVSLLGATAGDNVLSIFVLGAIAAALSGRSLAAIGLAGLLAGAGFGLKPVLAPFIIGLTVAVILCDCLCRGGALRLLVFALAGIAGTLLTGGWWMWTLWQAFGNPLMPYFNDIFRSPYVAAQTYSDPGFTAGLAWPRIHLPFMAGVVQHVAAEASFNEWRIPLGYGAGLALLLGWAAARGPATAGRRLALIVVATLVPWSIVFAIYRYVLAVEMLGPILIAVAALSLVPTRQAGAALAAVLLLFLLLSTRPPDSERVAFGPDLTGVQVPEIAAADHAVVLMAGLTPSAFVIPSFSPAVRFLRFDGYWIDPAAPDAGYARVIREAVAAAGPAVHILFDQTEIDRVRGALAAFLPGRTIGACRPVPHRFEQPGTNWGRLVLCDIES